MADHPKKSESPAPGKHTATVIWMHGLGDMGSSWCDGLRPMQKAMPHIKIVCPTAPIREVTLNFGAKMTSWHDIVSLDKVDAEEFKGLDESIQIVQNFIHAERKAGILYDRILVGGFSQGAGLAVRTSYTFKQKLAGVCALSGYLPFNGDFGKAISPANRGTPALLCHGESDPVVRMEAGIKCADTLRKNKIPTTLKLYPYLQHSTCGAEMREVKAFILQCLPPLKEEEEEKTENT